MIDYKVFYDLEEELKSKNPEFEEFSTKLTELFLAAAMEMPDILYAMYSINPSRDVIRKTAKDSLKRWEAIIESISLIRGLKKVGSSISKIDEAEEVVQEAMTICNRAIRAHL